MPPTLVAEETIKVGEPVVVEGPAPDSRFAAIFEDDGTTGYFYALDTSRTDQPIVDARQIYNVAQVTDRNTPSVVQILWSADGLRAALVINDCPHAVIDFHARRSYCRTGFPPPPEGWSAQGVAWEDAALESFQD